MRRFVVIGVSLAVLIASAVWYVAHAKEEALDAVLGPIETLYHDSGEVLAKGRGLKTNCPDGPVTIYYKNGQISSLVDYQRGKPHGEQKGYYADGKMKSLGNYRFGKKHGISKTYLKSGVLAVESNYENGLPEGTHTYYKETGKKDSIQEYSKGVFVKSTHYDDNGNVRKPTTEAVEIILTAPLKHGKKVIIKEE